MATGCADSDYRFIFVLIFENVLVSIETTYSQVYNLHNVV